MIQSLLRGGWWFRLYNLLFLFFQRLYIMLNGIRILCYGSCNAMLLLFKGLYLFFNFLDGLFFLNIVIIQMTLTLCFFFWDQIIDVVHTTNHISIVIIIVIIPTTLDHGTATINNNGIYSKQPPNNEYNSTQYKARTFYCTFVRIEHSS